MAQTDVRTRNSSEEIYRRILLETTMMTLVDRANKATSAELIPCEDGGYDRTIAWARELSVGDRNMIWDLFETNMREKYTESSWGWSPSTKKHELFHSDARYVLHYTDATHSNLAAFVGFRFDDADDEDVVYCYELQVASTERRKNLGSILMNDLASIALKFGFEKVMLTVFKANDTAVKFYQSIGYDLDDMSPDEEDEEEHLILSKRLD